MEKKRISGNAGKANGAGSEGRYTEKEVTIGLPGVTLPGTLCVPYPVKGFVIFSHGSGSSRLSRRNRYVAEVVQKSHFATLLFDLLTVEEDADYVNRFNIELLAQRLIGATGWSETQNEVRGLPIGYFGASTGAASALMAAAHFGNRIKAVVSRGGRPDLAAAALPRVTCPTLLIVGGNDEAVIGMNREAQRALRCENELVVIPGATHLFAETGKLEKVAGLAAGWYENYL